MPKLTDDCRLSRKSEQAILELLNPSNRTLAATAKKAGISERTLRYWMKLPQFQSRLQQEKKKLLKQGLDNLRSNFHLAAQTLGTLLADKSPVVRLRACQAIVDYNLKLLEQERGNQLHNPYYEYSEDVIDAEEGSSVMSIHERFLRLKEITKDNNKKINEELDKKEREKTSGDEITLKDP